MPRKKRKSKSIDAWVRRNQNKHLCQCGCGQFIKITRYHAKPSISVPRFISGHNTRVKQEEPEEVIEEEKESFWDKLSEEEKQRRISQLKSFEAGDKNPAWKGGRRYDENGYIMVRMPGHPFANDGYVYEHRLVVEERTRKKDPNNPLLIEVAGEKYLKPVAVVHHIDEVKTNNEPSNLMLLPHQRAHAFIHNSPLPMSERLRRIKLGIYHSRPLEEDK